MNAPPPAGLALAAPFPAPDLPLGLLEVGLLALVALIGTGFFAVLRSALLHSVTARVLEGAADDEERERLRPHLTRAEALATSASIFEITCQIAFVVLALVLVGEFVPGPTGLGIGVVVSVPLLVFAAEVLPAALRGERSDSLLRRVLPGFVVLQKPLGALLFALEGTRRATMRLFRIPERPAHARQIVEELRDVVEDSERERVLHASEREIIENVVDFHDVDVAEVMTPRTELAAVDIASDLLTVARTIAETGHMRIPVFEGNLDTIVGTVYARDVVRAASEGALADLELRALVRPVPFVPETKLVLELLAEFRRDGQKLAIVLDEYGGTAGIVTIGDIVIELFGEMPAELDEAQPEEIHQVAEGTWDVQGSTHVSDVNEELELDLPEEEDYETLAGYVLAELGRLPKAGEAFERDGARFEVREASDRRVLLVRVRPAAASPAARP